MHRGFPDQPQKEVSQMACRLGLPSWVRTDGIIDRVPDHESWFQISRGLSTNALNEVKGKGFDWPVPVQPHVIQPHVIDHENSNPTLEVRSPNWVSALG